MSKRRFVTLAILLLAAIVVSPSMAQETIAPTGSGTTFMVLSPKQIDPAKLLPPPPPDRSLAQADELDRLRKIQATRTDDRLRRAQYDANHDDIDAFAGVLGPRFDIARLPATRAVLDIARNDASVAAAMAKTAFHRHRPWIFDPSLTGCPRGDTADPLTSYPSGTAVFAYATAVMLTNLVPKRAPAIMARVSDFTYSRLVCEAHYPSDIAAGAKLGITVGALLIESPAMQAKLKAAKAELRAARVG